MVMAVVQAQAQAHPSGGFVCPLGAVLLDLVIKQ
jgi:hypothetical protein